MSLRKTLVKLYNWYDKLMPLVIIITLMLGIVAAKYIPTVMAAADTIVSTLIDYIALLAPIAIFIVLAPSLAKLLHTRKETKFGGFVIGWFTFTRILAGIWAAIFTALVLGLPLLPTGNTNSAEVIGQSVVVLGDMLVHSTYFYAIWVAVLVGAIAYYHKKTYNVLQKSAQGLEIFGDYLEPFIPILMFLIGAYIYTLPDVISRAVADGGVSKEIVMTTMLNEGGINILGMHISVADEFGLVWIYLIGSILIGVGCFIWLIMQLGIAKRYLNFSIKDFFKRYWVKVYPLAWSTSSEAVSMPLNLSLVKRRYPNVKSVVRRLACGLGAYLNINGTTMHVILLAGIVAVLIGVHPSLLELLIAVPIVALIGFGVPGIPGELVLFAVPMMKLLSIGPELAPVFLALYLALQVGLPDSFRTGANVTDNGLYAIILNKIYQRKYESTPTENHKPAPHVSLEAKKIK